MQDVLAVYARPHDPARPVVCMDEKVRHEALVRREALGTEGGARPPRRVVAAAR
jgi:hypothetical protein